MEHDIIWEGPGWYASHQVGQYESQRVETRRVPWCEELTREDWKEVSKNARAAGLGTAQWADNESELES